MCIERFQINSVELTDTPSILMIVDGWSMPCNQLIATSAVREMEEMNERTTNGLLASLTDWWPIGEYISIPSGIALSHCPLTQ